jgi:hypothetical protein
MGNEQDAYHKYEDIQKLIESTKIIILIWLF